MKCVKAQILRNSCIAKETYEMVLEADIASEMKPGQFVNIQIDGFLLRRPISICSIEDEHSFIIVYKVVGDGSEKLSHMLSGSYLDVFGPLGSAYPIHETEPQVLLIGGGAGVPPLYELAKQYRRRSCDVIVALGFPDADSVFYQERFEALGCHVILATMDGSAGTKGNVMDTIQEHHITCDFTCSCGPRPMLKAIEAVYTRGYMSFESRMACGMGACMACVAKDKQEENLYHRICKEGPVFPIGKVEF